MSRYGVVGYDHGKNGAIVINQMIEKPAREQAPSNRIIAGRYILQTGIFEKIAAVKPGAGGEIQLTDAMIALMSGQPFWGCEFHGATFDCGDKLGFLLANVAYGLAHGDIGPVFSSALEKLLTEHRDSTVGSEPIAAATSVASVAQKHTRPAA